MPFRVDKVGTKYKLYNLDKKQYTKKSFNTRESANNMKRTYMNYHKKRKK